MNNCHYNALTHVDVAEKLLYFARAKKSIAIFAHRSPDGDAVGSAFALKKIYEKLGGTAECVCTHEVPQYLRFLMKGQNTLIYDESKEYDVNISVDTASPSQFGDLSYIAEKIEFAIDHHGSYTEYADTYRDAKASATGEQIYEIYKYLTNKGNVEKDADICRLIYSAISADTGSFMYSNTTEKTHKITAELIFEINSSENGLKTAEIASLLHNIKSMSSYTALKVCISQLKTAEDGKIGYVAIDKSLIDENGLREEDFGAAVDVPRSLEGVKLAFVLRENKELNGEKEYKLSTRSNCNVSVAEICKKFGGGGHDKAAGGSITAKNLKDAENAVLNEFIKAIRG